VCQIPTRPTLAAAPPSTTGGGPGRPAVRVQLRNIVRMQLRDDPIVRAAIEQLASIGVEANEEEALQGRLRVSSTDALVEWLLSHPTVVPVDLNAPASPAAAAPPVDPDAPPPPNDQPREPESCIKVVCGWCSLFGIWVSLLLVRSHKDDLSQSESDLINCVALSPRQLRCFYLPWGVGTWRSRKLRGTGHRRTRPGRIRLPLGIDCPCHTM
jgi:hypothetical protein